VDALSARAGNPDRKISAFEALWWATTADVLHVLRPLLDAGIIRFAPPVHPYCKQCAATQKSVVRSVAKGLIAEMRSDLNVKTVRYFSERLIQFSSPQFIVINESPRIYQWPIRKRSGRLTAQDIETAFEEFVESEVTDTLFEASAAIGCGGVLVNNSRLSAATLRLLDGKETGAAVPAGENIRRVHLPTLEGLTPSQVVALREEARDALPAFRQRVSQGLMSDAGSAEQADVASKRLAIELRAEAKAVEAELKAIDLPGVRRSTSLLASAGLAFTVYGVTQGAALAATGMTALLATATHGLSQLRTAVGETMRARTKPSYVTLVADRLRKHSH
jgi:hypothetical protein